MIDTPQTIKVKNTSQLVSKPPLFDKLYDGKGNIHTYKGVVLYLITFNNFF